MYIDAPNTLLQPESWQHTQTRLESYSRNINMRISQNVKIICLKKNDFYVKLKIEKTIIT